MLLALYATLRTQHGERADPDTWWPISYGRTEPPSFERAITNILVQNTTWTSMRSDLDALAEAQLLTAQALSSVAVEVIAACITRSGLPTQKARTLQTLCRLVIDQFGTEAAFCAQVTREQLLQTKGIGEATADRILLYTCGRLAWPVDAYCLRVFAHEGLIPAIPTTTVETRARVAEIKQLVVEQLPPNVEDWQRLHALMQLEGERLRRLRSSSHVI